MRFPEVPKPRPLEESRLKGHPIRRAVSWGKRFSQQVQFEREAAQRNQEASYSDGEVTDQRKTTRREFLKIARDCILGAMAVGLVVDVTSECMKQVDEMRDKTIPRVKDVASNLRDESPESLEEGQLIPEDERTGQNILIGMIPTHFNSSIFGGYDFEDMVKDYYDGLLSNLSPGTQVKVMIPKGSKAEFHEYVDAVYPNLIFTSYEMPLSLSGYNYAQDVIFATGSKDDKGRFLLASSKADASKHLKLQTYYDRTSSPPATIDMRKLYDSNVDQLSSIGLQTMGDELLVADNNDDFARTVLPVNCTGGDVQPTRLPNGKTGLIVGASSILETSLFSNFNGNHLGIINKVVGLEFFKDTIENIKNEYKKSFNVDEVIFIGEDLLIDRYTTENGGHIDYSKMVREVSSPDQASEHFPFFHSDMVVKTATAPNGEKIAFCSDVETERENFSAETIQYLREVQKQFAQAGYKVIKVPCGDFASTNYVNGTMYTDSNGAKVVHVPQYGIESDSKAAAIYKENGFKVLGADMSQLTSANILSKLYNRLQKAITGIDNDLDPRKAGSTHCRTVVLD